MRKTSIYILICLLVLTIFSNHAAAKGIDIERYKQLLEMPAEKLFQRSYAYIPVNSDSAIMGFTVLVDRYKQGKLDKNMTRKVVAALNNLGALYQYQHLDFQKAYESLSMAKRIAEKNNYQDALPLTLASLASLFTSSDFFENGSSMNGSALPYCRQAFHSAARTKQWNALLACLINELEYARQTNRTAEVMPDVRTFRRLKIPKGTPLLTYVTLFCKGVEAENKGDYISALNAFRLMKGHIDITQAKELYVMTSLTCQADALSHMQKWEEASQALHRALDIASENGESDVMAQIYYELSICYSHIDKNLSERYRLMFYESRDSIMKQKKLNNIHDAHLHDELNSVRSTMNEIEHNRRALLNIVLILIGVIVIVGVVGAVFIRNYRRLRRAHRQLYLNSAASLEQEDNLRKQRDHYEKKANNTKMATADEQTHQTDADELADVAQKINKVLESELIFKDSFSLDQLAEAVGKKRPVVSQAIKEHLGDNFYSMLNSYRIKEACRRLRDSEHYGKFTVEGIGLSVGFKSRSNFITSFKKTVGIPPSEYRKLAEEA